MTNELDRFVNSMTRLAPYLEESDAYAQDRRFTAIEALVLHRPVYAKGQFRFPCVRAQLIVKYFTVFNAEPVVPDGQTEATLFVNPVDNAEPDERFIGASPVAFLDWVQSKLKEYGDLVPGNLVIEKLN